MPLPTNDKLFHCHNSLADKGYNLPDTKMIFNSAYHTKITKTIAFAMQC